MMAILRRRWHVVLGLLALAGATTAPAAGYQRPGITELVSVTSDGAQADGQSGDAGMSADGRFITFESDATNLVAGDTNGGKDVFVYDRETGTIERVSVDSDGTELLNGYASASISADGRYVAFEGLRSSDSAGQVFVRDRQRGTTELASVASDGTPGERDSYTPDMSADGRFVAFVSDATNLVAGDTNGGDDIFVHDRETGTTERVSVASDGSQGTGGSSRCAPFIAMSADGRFVAFNCHFDNLVSGDTNGDWDVFVRDRGVGTTERVSVHSDETEMYTAGNANLDISADGRFVTFDAKERVVPTRTTDIAVFLRDRKLGTTEAISVRSDGTEFDGWGHWPRGAAISADGRFVAFLLNYKVPADPSDPRDIPDGVGNTIALLRDRATGTLERLDVASDGAEANDSAMPAVGANAMMSADGRYVAFGSAATNLVAGDTNQTWDVYVRDRGPATGIGGLAVQDGARQHGVTGWATFSGATVASAEDSHTDGDDAAGAEMITASVIHRPELEDLLIRIDLASLPVTEVPLSPEEELLCMKSTTSRYAPALGWSCHAESFGGAPGTLYRLRFRVAQTTYEVQAMPADATTDPPTPAHAALYECTPACSETATLTGAVGTTGPQVHVSLPLAAIGVDGAADLTQIEASVVPPDSSAAADKLALPDAHIEPPQVKLGVAPPQTPEGRVPLTTTADLVDGGFSATLDTSALVGPQRLLARACLMDGCGFDAFDLGAFEAAPRNQSPPLIDGGPAVGSPLSCSPGEWSAYPAPTFAYQWLRDGVAIAGAPGQAYTAVDADAASAIACRVIAANSRGSAQATSAPVNVPAVPPSAGAAVANGTAEVGAVLTCVPSGFGGAPAPSYAYRWLRDGEPIPGATSDTYTVTDDDAGHALTCRVTATNAGGSAHATSAGRGVPALPDTTPDTTSPPAGATGEAPATSGSTPSGQPLPVADDGPLAGVNDGPFGRRGPLQIEVRPESPRRLRARTQRAVSFRLVGRETVTRLTASLTRGKRSYGRGRLAKLTGSRKLTVRLTRPLRRGAYALRLAATRADGSRARLAVRVRVR